MGSRRHGRVAAFQALYAWEESHSDTEQLLQFRWLDSELDSDVWAFAALLVRGVLEQIDSIDEQIQAHLERWRLERLNKVDLSILRLSTYSLLYQKDIPASVTINEAVEIARQFSAPESYRFVNGVLDGIRKTALS